MRGREVGGVDEYDVINAVKEGKIKKPIIAWCVGTCADYFNFSVQSRKHWGQAAGGAGVRLRYVKI